VPRTCDAAVDSALSSAPSVASVFRIGLGAAAGAGLGNIDRIASWRPVGPTRGRSCAQAGHIVGPSPVIS
jgi:hypothetical protein